MNFQDMNAPQGCGFLCGNCLLRLGGCFCGRGFSVVPSVELEKRCVWGIFFAVVALYSSFSGTEKAILPSYDMGFAKHTWKLTHSQVICLVPFVSRVYKSHAIRQK